MRDAREAVRPDAGRRRAAAAQLEAVRDQGAAGPAAASGARRARPLPQPEDARARSDRAPARRDRAAGDDAHVDRRRDRDPPRPEQALPLRRHEAPARRSASPPGSPGTRRRSASTRSSSSGGTRGGIRPRPTGRRTRSRSRPAPATRSARAGWGSPRPAVGIHGTPDPASIGYSVSHGCIRMLIPEVEWLFNQVEIGTPVYIVQMTAKLRLGAQVAAVAVVAALLGLLIWKVAPGRERGHVGARPRWHAGGAGFHARAARRRRVSWRSSRCAARRSSSTSGPPGAARAGTRCRCCRQARSAGRGQERRLRRHRREGLPRRRARSSSPAIGVTYPNVYDGKGSTVGRYGVTGYPETYFIDANGKVRWRIAGRDRGGRRASTTGIERALAPA